MNFFAKWDLKALGEGRDWLRWYRGILIVTRPNGTEDYVLPSCPLLDGVMDDREYSREMEALGFVRIRHADGTEYWVGRFYGGAERKSPITIGL